MPPECELGRESLAACTIDETTKILCAAVLVGCPWNMVEESLFARRTNSRVGCYADTADREIGVIGRDRRFDEFERGGNLDLRLISWRWSLSLCISLRLNVLSDD
jgi:hypothetical protein